MRNVIENAISEIKEKEKLEIQAKAEALNMEKEKSVIFIRELNELNICASAS